MCPVKLKEGLEASTEPGDWGECSKDCHLKRYFSNKEIYDEVRSEESDSQQIEFMLSL